MGLCIRALTFGYGRRNILKSIDVDNVPRGKLTALLGPNAAGKSTLFRCAAGLLNTGANRVFVDGVDIRSLHPAERARTVCFMPQNFSTNAALTVFEVVLLALKQLRGWRVQEDDIRVVEETLQRLGIEDLAEVYISELSGGQQQMVSVCQALVRTPSLFLLDEPTSALDLKRQLEVMSLIRETTRIRDVVTIVALHDLNLAVRFADHVLLMQDGRIVAHGTPEDVISRPALAQTYGVSVELARTSSGLPVVSASL